MALIMQSRSVSENSFQTYFHVVSQDQHSSMVEYHVPVAPGGVADIFYLLESNKSALQIKHFSVSQTTLDEVRRDKRTYRTETGTE